jgi:hypothetical protein
MRSKARGQSHGLLQTVGRWDKCLDRRRANHADAWNVRHTLRGCVLASSLTISLSGQAGLFSQRSNMREQHPTTPDHHGQQGAARPPRRRGVAKYCQSRHPRRTPRHGRGSRRLEKRALDLTQDRFSKRRLVFARQTGHVGNVAAKLGIVCQ